MKVLEQKTPLGVMTILSNGNVTLGITTERGIRISYISAFDCDNLCYHDDKLKNVTKLSNGETWYQLGGHRIWKSPEDENCYIDDNLPCTLKIEEKGASISSPVHKDGLAYAVKITFTGESTVKVIHAIKNCGETPQKIAAWGITALDPNGWVEIPFDNENGALLPNRNVVVWSYTDLDSGFVHITNDKVTVFNNGDKPLKVGALTKGNIKYQRDNIVFEKHTELLSGEYPDYYCNKECYANGTITEMETLSPLKTIKKDQVVSHTEIWKFSKEK